jgi:hypothetical protein
MPSTETPRQRRDCQSCVLVRLDFAALRLAPVPLVRAWRSATARLSGPPIQDASLERKLRSMKLGERWRSAMSVSRYPPSYWLKRLIKAQAFAIFNSAVASSLECLVLNPLHRRTVRVLNLQPTLGPAAFIRQVFPFCELF